jgi:hypothetical protein
MKLANWSTVFTVLAACLMGTPYASAALIGQVDDFEDGTTQGWVVGSLGAAHPNPPVNAASGGPLGADDNYLQLNAVGGQGAGSRLSVINLAQWSGDYTAAGISAISMDLRNLGSTDLSIRLYFENPTGGLPTDTAVSDSVLLPSGSGWTNAEFRIDSLSLTGLEGNVETLLANVTALRIIHSPLAEFPGFPIVAQLGVDNVTAVPEPSSLGLLGLGLLGLLAWRKKHESHRIPAWKKHASAPIAK